MEKYTNQDLTKGVVIETDDEMYYVPVGTHVGLVFDVNPHLSGVVELAEEVGQVGDLTHSMRQELMLPDGLERTVEFTILIGDASDRP